jgi:protein translocase SecG subunit
MLEDIAQIFLGIIIIALILIQQRGTEGGVLFGSQTEFFLKKRGLEKKLHYLTWFLTVIFLIISLIKIIRF